MKVVILVVSLAEEMADMTIAKANGRKRTRRADTMPHDRPADAMPVPEITLSESDIVNCRDERAGRLANWQVG